MNDTKGDGPIKPVRPITPRRPMAVTPESNPALRLKPSTSPVRAPPPPPRKHSITPPRKNSDHREIKDFFKKKPDPEPPSERMSIEIDVDEDLGDSAPATAESNFPSIPVDFDDPVSELPDSPVPSGRAIKGVEPLIKKFTSVLRRLQPGLEGKKLEFTEKGIFMESKKIGDVKNSPPGAGFRVWMHKIGLNMDSLPASAILAHFNIPDFFFADAVKRANHVSIFANGNRGRVEIKMCFHKEETPDSFLSLPLRTSSQVKKG